MKIGIGYDVHALRENRKLIIGGVDIPFEKGLYGHSDADVLIHAIMDSLLGAMGKGDIGKLFPDTDNDYKDVNSRVLLRKVYELMKENNLLVGNIDAVIIAQRPKMSPFIEEMKKNIANDLRTDINLAKQYIINSSPYSIKQPLDKPLIRKEQEQYASS